MGENKRGSWSAVKKWDRAEVYADETLVAMVYLPDGPEEEYEARSQQYAAHVSLIAAAPDLLEELEVREGDLVMLLKAVEAGDPKTELVVRIGDMLRETRAAIAKATRPTSPTQDGEGA